MAGLYIHVPFCASRCIYCGFYSTVPSGGEGKGKSVEERYVDAMCHEMELRTDEEAASGGETAELTSIYLGGGTPSQLSFQSLHRLFHTIEAVYHLPFRRDMGTDRKQGCSAAPIEVTMECNPDDVTAEFARRLRSLPVNRISMGVQTFSDERLRFLHRRHTVAEAVSAVGRLREAGIGNISVDLMFGFPGETLEEWEADIAHVLELGAEHISAYSLMYEEGTPLYRLQQAGKVREMDDELYRKMYDVLIDRLGSAGYEHYEISNFARLTPTLSDESPALKVQPSKSSPQISNLKSQISNLKVPSPFRSRHNSSYWHDVPYIGIGAAAHSYGNGKRSWNVADIRAYIDAIRERRLPREEEVIDADTHYNDTVMTALRTREGIELSLLSAEYRSYLMHLAVPFLRQGLLKEDGGRLHLTRKGIYVSDSIMSELMKV